MPSVKQTAREIVEKLSDEATWGDLMYEVYVRQKIEAGLTDADAGRTMPHEEVKARLLARQYQ